MDKPIVFIGAGGHAASVLEAASGCKIDGYVDLAKSELDLPYLGDDDTFMNTGGCEGRRLLITFVAGRACSLAARARLIARYEGCEFATVVAPTAYLAGNVRLGAGTAVMHRALVNVSSKTGRHCVLNTGCIVEHDCTLGDNVFIGPGAVICGGVTIGNNVYIGANSSIRPGTRIADNTVVGMGAAVVDNIDEPGVYIGVPAKKSVK